VAAFAEQPAAAFVEVVQPVLPRQGVGVHPVQQVEGPARRQDVCPERARERGVAAVEAHDQRLPRLGHRGPQVLELRTGETRRLLDEHRLTRPKCRRRQPGVRGVPRGDHDEPRVRIGQGLLDAGGPPEAEAVGGRARGQPRRARNRREREAGPLQSRDQDPLCVAAGADQRDHFPVRARGSKRFARRRRF
jgi:hypothetical protein